MMGVRTYREATAFLIGFDSAVMGGLLKGFREWLIVRVNGGHNMAFPWLVEMLMAKAPLTENDDKNRAEIEFLMATLDEFMTARSESDGLRRIFFEYERWLTRQRWYNPSSPSWLGDAKSVSRRGRASGVPARSIKRTEVKKR